MEFSLALPMEFIIALRNREKFKPIAFLLMHLCISLITQLERDWLPK